MSGTHSDLADGAEILRRELDVTTTLLAPPPKEDADTPSTNVSKKMAVRYRDRAAWGHGIWLPVHLDWRHPRPLDRYARSGGCRKDAVAVVKMRLLSKDTVAVVKRRLL